MKNKIIYRNKELEERIDAKDKAAAKVYRENSSKDPIEKAYKESSKSPNKMFKESMKLLDKLSNKKEG